MKIRDKAIPFRKPDKIATTSERLKIILDIRKIKQIDLSRSTGISRGAISNYVQGRYEPKSDIVQKLASALNCSEMWLWGYDVPMEVQDPTFDEKSDSPSEEVLTEGESEMLKLFRLIPEDHQQMVIQMIRAALSSLE